MEENKKNTYHYVTAQSSKLGEELVRLAHRCYDVTEAADKLAQEKRVYEWCPDPRYVAGGIWRFIFKNPPKAKKALMVVARDKDGNYECAPNLEYNCGLRLAKKIAALPHVIYKEVFEAFRFDYENLQYARELVPQFFVVGTEWVYVRSSFDLAALCPDLNACSEETFDAALRFIEEQESPTLLSEE